MTDRKIASAAARELKKQGLTLELGATVIGTKLKKQTVTVQYRNKKGEEQQLTVDKLIVAVGRKPHVEGLSAEAVGIKISEKGFIEVDVNRQTTVPNIYAIGDVIGGPMLAHKGSEEGILVAECLAGQRGHLNYDTIPFVIYTAPEIAWVGRSEEQLKAQGVDYRVGQFPFTASGRARAQGETAGLVRIIADAQSDRLLGVHILVSAASELIAEAVLAMEFEGSAEDLARTIHAHPTLSEVIHEAALDVAGRVIHA
jgi:dihydrolipoamide dehydrogenase